jgi:hypothetical protein
MKHGNAITDLHAALAHAAYEGFSPIKYEDRDWELFRKTKEDLRIKKTRRPADDDIEVHAMFAQAWGSTALGFGGLGGQAITVAYTTVLQSGAEFCVYFAGRFAYRVTAPGDRFFYDIAARRMADVRDHQKYVGKEAA